MVFLRHKNTAGDCSAAVEKNYIYYAVSNENYCCCFLFVLKKTNKYTKRQPRSLNAEKNLV